MIPKQYLFQCNANDKTGLGHLTRCLNIACAIKEITPEAVITFSGDFNDFAVALLVKSNLLITQTPCTKALSQTTFILDNYDIDQSLINYYRGVVKTFIKIDDFNEFDLNTLDLVINFRLHAENEQYSNKATCLGLGFFPFKKELIAIRQQNEQTPKSDINSIYIFIGGYDQSGAGIKLIGLLDSFLSNKQLFLVDKNCTLQRTTALEHNTLTYLPLNSTIENYYQDADFFITGGGLSKYEVAFCGIANAAISQNEGQAVDTKILANEGLTHDLGLTEQLLNNTDIETVGAKLKKIISVAENQLLYQRSKALFKTNSTYELATHIIRT
ncbi:hypothetical protein KO495_06340 [Colwellia sp. D2M02]|uniref:hypothetical protein n=1 Tax=Colwellia sp. D2M02 TaxID=2841562 RepID=UPI001C084C00|nr:hypothetical protein [Colwellia sp. D2M02]MBU2892942.1 hypothetical protein [Colwellia sp. D2M02]